MQTYSHLIIVAAINQGLKNKEDKRISPGRESVGATDYLPHTHTFPFLFGSVAPDIPLILLTIVFMASDLLAGRSLDPGNEMGRSNTGYLFETLFYQDPWVKTAHNLFHAPILVIFYTLLGYWAWRRGWMVGRWKWGAPLFWFGLGCTIHTLIDIPVHYDDGPLLLFPFNFEARFYSPLSYWDPKRGGIPFTIFEHLLDLLLLAYLLVNWWKRRLRRQAIPPESMSS